jgi:hypothetical protein
MKRLLLGLLLVVGLGTSAWAKFVCPPGRFTVSAAEASVEPLPSGVLLELGPGVAGLTGFCRNTVAGRFISSGQWLNRVHARWRQCTKVPRASLRSRFVSDGDYYCTRLAGVLRVDGRRFRIIADRVPECGNELHERGEECDGRDSPAGRCCTSDCRLATACP